MQLARHFHCTISLQDTLVYCVCLEHEWLGNISYWSNCFFPS